MSKEKMKNGIKNKGFTLVELIVVIGIIAVITVAITPMFLKYIEKSRAATDKNAIEEVAHATEAAYIEDGNKAESNILKIRISAKGDATYAGVVLAEPVSKIIPEDSYKYKSKSYRGTNVTIEIQENGKAKITYNGENQNISEMPFIKDTLELIFDGTFSDEDWEKIDAAVFEIVSSGGEIIDMAEKKVEELIDNGEITLIPDEECIVSGTKVTLADGSTKKVEDLLTTDKVLAFNHESGEYVEADILALANHGDDYYEIMNLEFANGEILRLISYHGLFDMTENKYVYLTNDNFTDYVGHAFAMQSEEGHEAVVLEKAYLTYEYVGAYAVVTDYHLNCYTEGILSIIPEAKIAVDAFEYDANLKYDPEKMQQDIDTYGLFIYEDFAAEISEEVFNLMPFKYVKVTLGKGFTTPEEVQQIMTSMGGYLIMFGEEATYIED